MLELRRADVGAERAAQGELASGEHASAPEPLCTWWEMAVCDSRVDVSDGASLRKKSSERFYSYTARFPPPGL